MAADGHHLRFSIFESLLNPIPPGLFEGGAAWGGGGGGRKVPAAYNSKTINDIEANNLVWFNWRMTSSLRHNDVITVIDVSEFKKRQINGTK